MEDFKHEYTSQIYCTSLYLLVVQSCQGPDNCGDITFFENVYNFSIIILMFNICTETAEYLFHENCSVSAYYSIQQIFSIWRVILFALSVFQSRKYPIESHELHMKHYTLQNLQSLVPIPIYVIRMGVYQSALSMHIYLILQKTKCKVSNHISHSSIRRTSARISLSVISESDGDSRMTTSSDGSFLAILQYLFFS
uniref:Uncharacterized protein n=1 Tax=Spironucleus salmonicida TaxID=348837 RepID=V6LX84_9EUKA|eukprot:EST45434.1 Hypothetical protein SS50377_14627 [Spironucleus salmonicida]